MKQYEVHGSLLRNYNQFTQRRARRGGDKAMKKLFGAIVAAITLFAIPLAAQPQYAYTAQSGVSLLTSVSATATATGSSRLPSFSGYGTLNVTEAGITGSPSGCTLKLAYQANNSVTATSTVSTTSFTPSTGVQTFVIQPSVPTGDNYVLTYACSSTYPTAGTLSVSFSPAQTEVLLNTTAIGDPCKNPTAPTASVAFTGVSTITQEIALTAGKSVYLCQISGDITSAGTFTVSYGTGTNCGTGTTSLAALTLVANTPFSIGWGGAIATAPSGNAVCITASAGTGAGVLSYVQQ